MVTLDAGVSPCSDCVAVEFDTHVVSLDRSMCCSWDKTCHQFFPHSVYSPVVLKVGGTTPPGVFAWDL